MAQYAGGHRPGHDEHALHDLRPRRPGRRDRPEGARADLSRSRAGSSTTRWRSGSAPRRSIGEALEVGQASPRTSSPALGITNQRETTVVWDKTPASRSTTRSSGRTRARTRSATSCGRRRAGPLPREDRPADRHLLLGPEGPLDPRQRRRRARRAPRPATCCSATSTPGCIWNLTGGADGGVHVTDVTNASRTMLMDLATLDWDDELPRPSASRARCCPRSGLRARCTARPSSARSRASRSPATSATSRPRSFGQTCFAVGEAKNTYGTGQLPAAQHGHRGRSRRRTACITTVGYKIGDQAAVYCLEGSIAITGALVQWLRDNLGLIQTSAEIEALAKTVEDNGGVLLRAGVLGPVRPVLADRRARRRSPGSRATSTRGTSPARRSRRPRSRPARWPGRHERRLRRPARVAQGRRRHGRTTTC